MTDQTLPLPVNKSETLHALYPDELMMQAFGTLTPTLAQRTNYFQAQWESWRANRALLPVRCWDGRELTNHLQQLGLKNMWDFQVKRRSVRFRTPEYLALCVISFPEAEPH